MSGSVDTHTRGEANCVEDRTYSGDVQDWASVQSRVELWIPEPRFVYAFTATDWDTRLVVALYIHDGQTFSALVRLTRGTAGSSEIARPLRRARAPEIESKLIGAVPELLCYLPQIRDWLVGLQLKHAPELIAVVGNGFQVQQLLRDALGLDGDCLGGTYRQARLLRLSPSQYVALLRLVEKSAGVSIVSEVLDVRG